MTLSIAQWTSLNNSNVVSSVCSRLKMTLWRISKLNFDLVGGLIATFSTNDKKSIFSPPLFPMSGNNQKGELMRKSIWFKINRSMFSKQCSPLRFIVQRRLIISATVNRKRRSKPCQAKNTSLNFYNAIGSQKIFVKNCLFNSKKTFTHHPSIEKCVFTKIQ